MEWLSWARVAMISLVHISTNCLIIIIIRSSPVGNMPVDRSSSYVHELDISYLSVSQKISSRFKIFTVAPAPIQSIKLTFEAN
jgi:hypothetical protein